MGVEPSSLSGMDRAGFYRGTVVSNADPAGLFRVRADVPQILGTSTMGWCRPMMGSVNGIPEVGELIWIAFEGGDTNYPVYLRGNTLSLDSLTDGTVTSGTALDTRTPSPPQNLMVTSEAYFDSTGVLQGRVTCTWDPVATATDGTSIVIGGYELWGMPAGGSWGQITSTETLLASWAPFDVGSSWQFMVRARAAGAPTLGAFSAPVPTVVSSTVAAPGMPSPPVVTSSLSLVRVTWNGLDATGVAMSPSFAYVQVAIDTTASPATPTVYGALPLAGTVQGVFTAGTTQYVKIRAVDVLGAATAWTTPIPIVVQSVYQDDSIQSQVAGPIASLTTSVNTIQGAVVITNSPPMVKVTDGAVSPTEVRITPGVLNFYSQGVNAASIDATVSGGLMTINAAHVGHHLIQNYDSNTTVVRWQG